MALCRKFDKACSSLKRSPMTRLSTFVVNPMVRMDPVEVPSNTIRMDLLSAASWTTFKAPAIKSLTTKGALRMRNVPVAGCIKSNG